MDKESGLPLGVKPLWIEAAFTAEYERDTLPLLFASDRIFVEYYDALAQKNRSLHSAIEQIRDENAAARNYRVEGMWREAIEALMRCVELRRAVFDQADFQYLAALRHCILSMLNFASYFMKEASGGNSTKQSGDEDHNTAAARSGGGGDAHKPASQAREAEAAMLLSRAFELLKRAEDACAKFAEHTVDRSFFRAVVENNFALYFMKKKLYKAAAQRLQLAAKAWQVVAPRGAAAAGGGSSGAAAAGAAGAGTADGGTPAVESGGNDAVNFYFAVQRGVGECACGRFESGLELFKRAVAMAPQLAEEQEQQRADADKHDEEVAAGRAPPAGASKPNAAARGTHAGGDADDSDADDARAGADDGGANKAGEGAGAAAATSKSAAHTRRRAAAGAAGGKQAPQQQQQQHGPVPVQVALQLLGVPVSVAELTQVALHHNIGVAFIGMRRYREALPWCTKASEEVNALPANPSVRTVTSCAEFCHKMNQERGNVEYRMKRSEYHQTDHLKKFRSLHSAIKPNAGATAFERRRRALHNAYKQKHGGGADDDGENEGATAAKSSSKNRSGSRSRSAVGNRNASSMSSSSGGAVAAAGGGGTSRQSAEALRQYLRTLTYEQLVAEFGPDGKRRVEAGDSSKKRVRETSPHLLKLPKHKLVPAAADSADASGGGDAH